MWIVAAAPILRWAGTVQRIGAGFRFAQEGKWWFLLDKSGGGGLDDWEVKIADFVVVLGKDAKKKILTR